MDLQEEVAWGLDWIDLVWGQVTGCCECCNEPQDSINLRDRDSLQELGVDGRIILNWIFRKKWDGGWAGLIW